MKVLIAVIVATAISLMAVLAQVVGEMPGQAGFGANMDDRRSLAAAAAVDLGAEGLAAVFYPRIDWRS